MTNRTNINTFLSNELKKLGYKGGDPTDWYVEDEHLEDKLFYEDGTVLNAWDRNVDCMRIRAHGVDEIQTDILSLEKPISGDVDVEESMHDLTGHFRVESGKNRAKIYPMGVRLKYGSGSHAVDSRLQYKPDYCHVKDPQFPMRSSLDEAICEKYFLWETE